MEFFRAILDRLQALMGAAALTLSLFLLLPVIQAIADEDRDEQDLQAVENVSLPPPPPPVEEEEPEPEEDEPEDPPELVEEAPLLDLDQIELALSPGLGGGLGADFEVDLSRVMNTEGGLDELFSLADLDQKPRIVHRVDPIISSKMRKQTPVTLRVIFIVDRRGRVSNPKVQGRADPTFERSALAAVKKWRFEPGKRNGQPVRFRMLCPITFPK